MKRMIYKIGAVLLALHMLAGGILAADVLQQSELTLADSLALENLFTSNGGTQQEHILTYSPGGDVAPAVVYGDTLYGKSTMNHVQDYLSGKGLTAVGAVNAAFFDLGNGLPIGMMVTDGILRANGDGYTLGITEDGEFMIGDVVLEVRGKWGDEDILLHYNQLLTKNNGIVLYSGDYDTKTKGKVAGYHVLLDTDDAHLTLGGEVECTVRKIAENAMSCSIPEGCFVLSLAKDGEYEPFQNAIHSLKVGDKVTVSATISDGWEDVVYAVGGSDLLVENGEPRSTFSFVGAGQKAARTAVGIKHNGDVICYTVDEIGLSKGITLGELARRMAELGCETAINLDGGSSTCMGVTQPGDKSFTTVNSPAAGQQCGCANYLFFTRPTKKAGDATQLFIYPYDRAALPGGQITMTAKAADDNYMAAAVPGEIAWSADGGQMQGNVFTAGSAGTAKIKANAGSLSGSVTVQVVESPTDLEIRREDTGKKIEKLRLEAGSEVELTAYAAYQGLELAATDRSFTWSVDSSLGAVDEDGTLTASQEEGAGKLTVRCGSKTAELPLEVKINPMTDIEGHWARPYITELYFDEVLLGSENAEGKLVYRPDASMTRQEFVVALMRWLKVDVSKYAGEKTPFADSSAIASWAADAMKAAYKLEYFTGSKEGTRILAQPGDTITREAAMTILARTQKASSESDALEKFSDQKKVSSWAKEALTAMVERGVIDGIKGELQPQGNVTRCQVAKMLYLMQ